MKKLFFAVLIILIAFSGCSKPEDDGGNALVKESIDAVAMDVITSAARTDGIKGISDTCKSMTYSLIAGQTIPVGTVVVSNDLNNIYVTYNTTGAWKLAQVHLFISDTEFTGRIAPGQADFMNGDLPNGTTTFTFTIPMDTIDCGSSIWLQAHAAVNGETAYGGTITPAGGGSWYGNILYTVECCDEPEDPECNISASVTSTDVRCFGASTGAINLTVTGGTAPFTYIWSNGATTEDLSGIPAGKYSVVVTSSGTPGAAPCTTEVKDIIIHQPNAININGDVNPVSCKGNDGAINITVTGGTGAYTFLWSNGADTEDVAGLAEGNYSVTVYDANRCESSARFSVGNDCEPEPEKTVAYARKTYDPMVHCFLTDPLITPYNPEGQWGWTNGIMPENETFQSTYYFWINVTECDVTRAVKVAEMKLFHFEGVSTATIKMENGYKADEIRLYIGNDPLPEVNGVPTVDPADLPLVHSLNAASSDSFTVNGITGGIYIIGYLVLDQELEAD